MAPWGRITMLCPPHRACSHRGKWIWARGSPWAITALGPTWTCSLVRVSLLSSHCLLSKKMIDIIIKKITLLKKISLWVFWLTFCCRAYNAPAGSFPTVQHAPFWWRWAALPGAADPHGHDGSRQSRDGAEAHAPLQAATSRYAELSFGKILMHLIKYHVKASLLIVVGCLKGPIFINFYMYNFSV